MPEARMVHVHLGLPKTGTTYLQQVLAKNRKALSRQNVAYPGRRVDHFLPAQDVLGRPFQGHADPRTKDAWQAVVAEAVRWPGSSVLSHELLATARGEVVDRVLSDLAPLRVHVVVTMRDFPRQLLAVWQEDVKNGSIEVLPDYLDRIRRTAATPDRLRRKFWRYQDGPGILAVWAERLGPERITVVTVPRGAHGPDELWRRFAQAIGVDPVGIDPTVSQRNVSLGAAETELVRLINEWASANLDWPDYRRLVKKHLAEDTLASRSSSPRLALPAEVLDWASEQSAAMAADLADAGYRVIGSLDDLTVPRPVPSVDGSSWPPPATDVLAAAVNAVEGLLAQAAAGGGRR
jgi:hypothetical protein